MSSKPSELTLSGRKALQVIKALSKTASFRIVSILRKRSLDVSALSKELNLSQPYVSQCVKDLHSLGLIEVNYKPGKKGIRKICEGKISKITIKL